MDPQFTKIRKELDGAAAARGERWQGGLYGRIEMADGLALDRVKVVSPFAEKMKYNLLGAFMVIPRTSGGTSGKRNRY